MYVYASVLCVYVYMSVCACGGGKSECVYVFI